MSKEPKKLELRVYRRHHTHDGNTYRVGETFQGTQSLLDAFADRLELAVLQEARDKAAKEAKEATELAKQAEDEADAEAAAKAAAEVAAAAKAEAEKTATKTPPKKES